MGNQSIEKEMKTALSSKKYAYLYSYFQCEQLTKIEQKNYYFDTLSKNLRKNKVGLRIRLSQSGGEFTLKEHVAKYEKLETTDYFSVAEGKKYIETRTFPNGSVAKQLEKYAVKLDELTQIGYLKNERYEIETDSGMWVLDKSYFPSGISYELEFEYTSSNKAFFDFLAEHTIPYQKVPSKLARAIPVD